MPCGSWHCSVCGWRKQQVAAYLAFIGMRSAHNRGDRLRMMTLTEDPKRPFTDVASLSKAWNRLRTDMTRAEDKKKRLLREYCLVIEMTKKGRPHIHCVMTGQYIKQWKLSKRASRAGFGKVADIRAVHFDPYPDPDDRSAASYISKELSGYLAKQKRGDDHARLVAKRRRPMRTSRGWYPGGMRAAEKELLEQMAFEDDGRDRGPWWFVIGDASTTLTIRGTDQNGEAFEVKDLAASPKLGDVQGKGGDGASASGATATTAALDDDDDWRRAA